MWSVLALLVVLLARPEAAVAQDVPSGWQRTPQQVADAAVSDPRVREERAGRGRTVVDVAPRLQERVWDVSVFAGREEIAVAVVDDASGRVLEAWTGPQVQWPMARGYPGAFGGAVNAPWVWIVLGLLFLAPFLRGPPSIVHLDVAALLAFSGAYAAFNVPHLKLSATVATVLLAYLLARMLWVAWRGGSAPAPTWPASVFVVGLVFLLGFRAIVSITGGNVVDVGYSGVIGADRLPHGEALYGAFPDDNEHGDTYGPVAYAAYVPFELAFPWSGTWDELPAARAAAVAFDLACVALCWLLGRRLGGPRLGLLLAYLWAAYPFTLLVMASSANDALVGAFVLGALLLAARPVGRGVVGAMAGLTKFAPLALLPLLATYRHGRRGLLLTAAAALVTGALLLAPFDVGVFWDRTLGFQAGRSSPFSLWGSWELAARVQPVATLAAVALAVAVAFVPRRRDRTTLCALAAAVLIALQLALEYWFYLYLVWFVALVWAALLAPSDGARRSDAARV
ncbi:hypothetical protein [Solirubrobacter deserti]|uniref:DUF2029 domain-containing protein n=1 Tax=Solirubrobacter deserti TaxID=2282478 RepID=A0ABT4RSY7_9ACTN|nr:hypothetical protein [Solirubrobacter deserti]MDA0141689.1 hypothetical protein [Solirubrobacter deserti]